MTFAVSEDVTVPLTVGQPVLALACWMFFHAFQRAKGRMIRKMSWSMA
jgi:hypothetical protein